MDPDPFKDAVAAAARARRIASDSGAITVPGGFCVPSIYDTGGLLRSMRLNPDYEAWLERLAAEEAARPRRQKVARWIRHRRREASWRIAAAWKILAHGATLDGYDD